MAWSSAATTTWLNRSLSWNSWRACAPWCAAGRRRLLKKLQVGDLVVDVVTHEVSRGGVSIDLSRTEFLLLEFLMKKAERVVKRRALLEAGWRFPQRVGNNTLDAFVRLLRLKVDRDHPEKRAAAARRYVAGDVGAGATGFAYRSHARVTRRVIFVRWYVIMRPPSKAPALTLEPYPDVPQKCFRPMPGELPTFPDNVQPGVADFTESVKRFQRLARRVVGRKFFLMGAKVESWVHSLGLWPFSAAAGFSISPLGLGSSSREDSRNNASLKHWGKRNARRGSAAALSRAGGERCPLFAPGR